MLKKIVVFSLFFVLFFTFSLNLTNNNCFSANYDMYEEDDEETENSYKQYTIADPFEKLNRKIFAFNMFFLDNIGEPVSNFYTSMVGKDVRYMIDNFGDRFSDVSTLFNSILQFNIKNAFKTVATFSINMIFGVFGLFNPAEKMGLYRDKKTISDTLAFYYVGDGFFIMLPFLGPSTLRDTASLTIDYFINPLSYDYFELLDDNRDLEFLNDWKFYVPRGTIMAINKLDLAVAMNKKFISQSIDPYNFVKNAFIQNKISKTNNKKE